MNEIMDQKKEDIDYKLLLDIVPQPLVLSNCEGAVIYTNIASRHLGFITGNFIWEQPFQGLPDCASIDEFNAQLEPGLYFIKQSSGYNIQLSEYSTQGTDGYLYSLTPQHTVSDPISVGLDSENAGYDFNVEEIEDYAILMLDREGTITKGNKGLQNVKGYTIDEVIGKHFATFYPEQDRIEGLPQKMLIEAEAKGKAKNEGWRMRKDGSLFWANIVITTVHDTTGNTVGFTKVARDFTDKKLAEEQREQQSRRIEAKNRQLEEFAYITSHDLQEPLRKISIFTHFIEKNISDRESVETYLRKISSSATRMSSLISDILEYARVLENTQEQQKIDLKVIVDGVLDDFELLITEKNVSVTLSGHLPVLSAVTVQMRQLFTNLINNAIKFSRSQPVIEISSHQVHIGADHKRLPKGNYHSISLTDNGIGFDEQYAEEIFKPFKRLNSEFKGTGIGLAVCQKIVENHSGAIEVASMPSQGTTFTILLPE